MKYGVHTFLWTQTFGAANLELLPQLKEHGFDGIEIARYQFNDFPAAKIGVEAARNGLECTLCCGLTGELSLISDDSAVRRKAFSFIQQAIQIAAELGVKTMVGPLVAPIGHFCNRSRTMDEWYRGVEGLQTLGDILNQYGIILAIEPLNRYQTYFLNTIADAVALCDAVDHPNVGILFDVFHANIEEKSIPEAIKSAERHLKHMHVCENDRGIPGTGHIPWDSLLRTLQELHYDRWVVIESFNFLDQKLAALTRTWRELAPTPEAIAYEGLMFLKQQCQC